MIKYISHIISWGCLAIIAITTVFGLATLINIEWFAELARNNLQMPIQWSSVENWQWYSFWALLMTTLSLGSIGLFFLHRAYANFANGELFNISNSTNVKRFAIFMLAQTIAKPIILSLASILLSMNHPAKQKVLTISFGSQDIMMLGMVMILWTVSKLLVLGHELQFENQKFI
jgi:hypothetical protein